MNPAARPCEPLRGLETGGISVHENPLQGRQIGSCGFPEVSESNVVRPVSHAFDCPQPLRGGACTCDPDLRTTSRGFTYDLGQMLGEGWYDDDV